MGHLDMLENNSHLVGKTFNFGDHSVKPYPSRKTAVLASDFPVLSAASPQPKAQNQLSLT